jgi:hypothetical protein
MRADSVVVWARARVSSARASRSSWTRMRASVGGDRGGVDLVADALDDAVDARRRQGGRGDQAVGHDPGVLQLGRNAHGLAQHVGAQQGEGGRTDGQGGEHHQGELVDLQGRHAGAVAQREGDRPQRPERRGGDRQAPEQRGGHRLLAFASRGQGRDGRRDRRGLARLGHGRFETLGRSRRFGLDHRGRRLGRLGDGAVRNDGSGARGSASTGALRRPRAGENGAGSGSGSGP